MYFKQYLCILYINIMNKSKTAVVNCVLIILFICRRARARSHGWQVVRILYLRLLAPPYQLMIHWLHYTLLQIFIIYDGHTTTTSHISVFTHYTFLLDSAPVLGLSVVVTARHTSDGWLMSHSEYSVNCSLLQLSHFWLPFAIL